MKQALVTSLQKLLMYMSILLEYFVTGTLNTKSKGFEQIQQIYLSEHFRDGTTIAHTEVLGYLRSHMLSE